MPQRLFRRLPLIVIVLAGLAGALLLRDFLSFEALARNHSALLAARDAHPALTAAAFAGAYIVIVTLSLPGATVMTLAGGFLFGVAAGTALNVLAAGSGAVLVYLAARAGLGAEVAARITASGGGAARVQASLQRNVWSALFAMRLMPVIPFFLCNLLPAFAGVALLPFAVTTFVGIVPAALVFTSVGSGLSQVFASGGSPDLSLLTAPEVLLPLAGLAALALLPVLLRALKRGAA